MAKPERVQPQSIKLDSDLQQRLKALSSSRDRSVHWLMRQAIEHYVEREERADALRLETLKRWEEVEIGRTLDNASVTEWLSGWGSADETERPQ